MRESRGKGKTIWVTWETFMINHTVRNHNKVPSVSSGAIPRESSAPSGGMSSGSSCSRTEGRVSAISPRHTSHSAKRRLMPIASE